MSVELHLGDCLQLLDNTPDASIDAILCDLPYGSTLCAWDKLLDFEKLWAHYLRVAKHDAPIILFSAQPFTSKLIMSQPALYRHIWYWEKEKGTNFFRTFCQPLRVIEEIVVFSRTGQYTYNPQMVLLDKPYKHTMPLKHSAITGGGKIADKQTGEAREYKTYTHSQPKNLVKFARDKANKSLVPTQKPLGLLEYFVKTYTKEGDVVLDNTMGSGTCGVACKRLGRSFIGMELSEKHFAIASDRIENACSEAAISDDFFLFGGGESGV